MAHSSAGVSRQPAGIANARARNDNAMLGACARLINAESSITAVQSLQPWKSSTIYRSDYRRERNDGLMSVHTSGEFGDVLLKNFRDGPVRISKETQVSTQDGCWDGAQECLPSSTCACVLLLYSVLLARGWSLRSPITRGE